ncbi:general odorant-binding protein 2-like [Achroia grisella]|uniref:general odorant-binding protein 2-like n=1 Tax=Achroia grisella TaxID=688607 RepID=UPI0027D28A5F|nr:general odorant-binding protein 2-like [Achroia grisella]
MVGTYCFLFGAIVLASISNPVRGTAEVMSHVTAHYGKTLEECRQESGLTTEIMEEFKHFWSDNFEIVHRELGCAMICMSNKFSLLKEDTRIHHDNMNDYVKSFPNGDVLAAKMVELIHNCEKKYDDVEDDCTRVMKTAACFRNDARKEGIAPEVAMIEAVMERY